MTFLVLILAVAATAIAVVALVNTRRQSAGSPQPTALVPATVVDHRQDLARTLGSLLEGSGLEANSGNVLVHAGADGSALVFGSDIAVDRVGETLERLPRQLTTMAVGGNAAVQGIITGGEMSGRLVRLSEQSYQAMKKMTQLKDEHGNILGVLQKNGKFNHVVRFKDIANVQALAGVTGALSTMAMQAQLQRIEKALAELGTDVEFLVEEVFLEARATTLALDEVIGSSYRIARATGELTSVTWEPVAHLDLELAVHHNKTLLRLDQFDRKLKRIGSGAKDRKDTLKDLLEDDRMLEWVELSLEATRLRSAHEALRLWRAVTTGDPAGPAMAQALKADMAARHQLLLDVHHLLTKEVEQIADISSWRRLNPIRYKKLEKLVDRTSPKMAQVTAALLPLALGSSTDPAEAPDSIEAIEVPKELTT